jgi:hypothetical protein
MAVREWAVWQEKTEIVRPRPPRGFAASASYDSGERKPTGAGRRGRGVGLDALG